MHKKRLLPLCIALVASGQLHAQTTSSSQELVEEVEVTGVRAAELNAREEERSKNIFSSVISQDDAGNFADQNVAESLQRLPGITLQKSEGEGKFVSVRGLGPGFVSVQQNGSELATAGDDGRAFSLDAIPADLLGAIEVFKSLTPDMDLNSIGGVVNVKTVSAFDRKKDSLRLNVQSYYQDYAEEQSPKVSLQGTNLFADDTIGIGYSLSWEERTTINHEMLHHETTDPRFVQQDIPSTTPDVEDLSSYMLIPFEFQNRQELAERERKAMSLDFGWRPNENSEYYLRTTYTQYTDMDLAWREYYRFGQAQADDIVYIDPDNSTFGIVDADVQQQMFIQETDNTTKSYSAGGKNIFDAGDGEYTFDYDYSWSEATSEKPDGRRVQFRVRDVPLIARFDKDYIRAQAVSAEELVSLIGVGLGESGLDGPSQYQGYGNAGISLDKFMFDNLFIEDASRSDELKSINLNLKRDFSDGWLSYWKTGISVKERVRERNQDRWSLTPSSEDDRCFDSPDPMLCTTYVAQSTGKLTLHETAYVNHPSFVYPAITRRGAENLLDTVKVLASDVETQQGLESIYRDYTLSEDTFAAYFMGEFNLAENQSLIVGARWDQTKFYSDGYFAINNDSFDLGRATEETVSFDYSIPMMPDETKYDNWLPSIHYRFEPREDILIRSSIWTSFTRPSFDQARTFANLESDFSLCNPVTNVCSNTAGGATQEELKDFYLGPNNTLRLGNPSLVAMTSTNYDASIGWYADESLFMQAAVFYKDIADYIVDVQGIASTINDLPVVLPVDQVDAFTIDPNGTINNVNTTINGDNAKVYGIELTLVKNFDAGFFVQSNMTFMNSEATLDESIRVGSVQLPEQADTTANVTVGWENEDISVRLSGNYNSAILKRIGACPADSGGRLVSTPNDSGSVCKIWADQYLDDTFGLDFKATYQITDELKVYFDALNVTDQYMTKYFRGNEYSGGKIMYHSEAFGRSFQVGLNYKFM